MKLLLIFITLSFSAISFTLINYAYADQNRALFPQPQEVSWGDKTFAFNDETTIEFNDETAKKVALYFSQFIQPATGYTPELLNVEAVVLPDKKSVQRNRVRFIFTPENGDNTVEGSYQLKVTANDIIARASSDVGLFYAAQTLRQLFSADIESRMPINKSQWLIPSVYIVDEPRFKHRGMHLDVSRHFFDVAFVKRYVDWLAFHKLNYFQWHLTDDQGWRIEIKQFPKLTTVGGNRAQTVVGHTYDYQSLFDNKPHQGFYTQAQIKDVLAYAKARHIEVIPEVGVPGHSSAFLAAYPEYSCHQTPVKVEQRFGIFEQVLCPTEATFTMLAKVYQEVAALFPSKYIHIGGDEVIKKQWLESQFVQQLMKDKNLGSGEAVQSYFIKRVSQIITGLDKTLIGWDEIIEGGIAKDAVIMSWRGIEGGIAASEAGHDVIMSPYQYTYLDAYQSKSLDEPKAIHGYLSLKMVYNYDPVPANLAPQHQQHILGAQGALWTEYIETPRHAEYMLLPRLSALAEVFWTKPQHKNWSRYSVNVGNIINRYQQMGLNPSTSAFNANTQVSVVKNATLAVKLSSDIAGKNIFYTLDGSEPGSYSSSTYLYKGAIKVIQPTVMKVATESAQGIALYGKVNLVLAPHKALGKKISFVNPPKTGKERLLDGIMAYQQYYNVDDFAVFYDEDLDAVIDFDKPTELSQVQLGIDTGMHRQLQPPTSVEVMVSNDGVNWQSAIRLTQSEIKGPLLTLNFEQVKVQYLRVIAINAKNSTDPQIPKLPLYIDEIAVY